MMILRVNALYGGSIGATVLLCTLLALQVSVQAWLLSGARGEQYWDFCRTGDMTCISGPSYEWGA